MVMAAVAAALAVAVVGLKEELTVAALLAEAATAEDRMRILAVQVTFETDR
jgi:hypothetical protein